MYGHCDQCEMMGAEHLITVNSQVHLELGRGEGREDGGVQRCWQQAL